MTHFGFVALQPGMAFKMPTGRSALRQNESLPGHLLSGGLGSLVVKLNEVDGGGSSVARVQPFLFAGGDNFGETPDILQGKGFVNFPRRRRALRSRKLKNHATYKA